MAKATSGKRIAVIGRGHMGSALVQGLVQSGVARSRILVSDDSRHNASVARSADIIFIAVKPSVVRSVLQDIKDVARGKLIASLAAGVTVGKLRDILGRNVQVARIMPNIPIAHGDGVIGVYAEQASAKAHLKKLLAGLGFVVEVKKERELDTLTLIAGCGPGIVAALVDMMAKRARALGISKYAEEIAVQTFMGTVRRFYLKRESARELQSAVATKGGVTEAILKEMQKGGFEKIFAKAIGVGAKKLKSIRA